MNPNNCMQCQDFPTYWPGLSEHLAKVDDADESELLRILDDLYGTNNLRYGATLEEVRDEAKSQLRRDYRACKHNKK